MHSSSLLDFKIEVCFVTICGVIFPFCPVVFTPFVTNSVVKVYVFTFVVVQISEAEEGDGEQAVRQLPCRCVPFGVDTAPSIRVIRPSAMFYTVYQSVKVGGSPGTSPVSLFTAT